MLLEKRCGLLLLLLCAFSSAGQNAPAQTNPAGFPSDTTLQATTRAVVLDVVVTDGAGRSVDGLTKQDFVLQEDGVEQSIVTFEAASIQPDTAGHESPAENILLIDEMNAQFTDVGYARYRMNKLLGSNGGRLEQFTSLMALTDKGLVVLQDATRDGNALMAALNRHRPALPARLMMAARDHDSQRIALSLAALHEIAAAASGSNVRKNLIWISPGFPILSSFVLTGESQDFVFNEIRRLSVDLLHARITVYTIDPRGVYIGAYSGNASPQASGPGVSSNPDVLASRQAFGQYVQHLAAHGSLSLSDVAIYQIAQETGGRSFWGRNDIDAVINSGEQDGARYYTLSYYPANRNFDSNFRKISVKLHQPGLKARTRAGYFAIPDPPPPSKAQIEDDLKEALANPVRYTNIRVAASAVAVAGDANSRQIVLQVDPHDLAWRPLPDGRLECAVTTATASFSSASAPVDVKSHHFTANLPKPPTESQINQPATIKFALPVSAQASRLRVVLRDESSGRMGTADVAALTGKP